MEHHHRSTAKPNKKFKGRNAHHKSKRAISKMSGGRVEEVKRESLKKPKPLVNKQQERNRTKQKVKSKREALLAQKRGIGPESAPKLISFVNLGKEKTNVNLLRNQLLEYLGEGTSFAADGPVTIRSKKYKTRFTLFHTSEEIYYIMDISKIADIIIFVIHAEEGITEEGKKLISILKAQGIGAVFPIVQGLNAMDKKRAKIVHKQLLYEFQREFPSVAKLMSLDDKSEVEQVVRFLDLTKLHDVDWRKNRPYLLADGFEFVGEPKIQGEFQSLADMEPKGTLVVSGYVKGGARLSSNLLVHIPFFGDFQINKIVSARDPAAKEKKDRMEDDAFAEVVLHQFDPEKRDTLQAENELDPLANEQNFPEEEDFNDDFGDIEKAATKLRRVPKGTSSYQSAWLSEGSDEEEEEDMEDEKEEKEEKVEFKVPKAKEGNTVRFEGEAERIEASDEDEKMSVQESHLSIKPSERSNYTLEELEKEELEWPDEKETPVNERASVRFQKYRGLKSFRTSYWDPKESLPENYARIFQFENWQRALRKSRGKADEGVLPGTYVKVHIANFPQKLTSKIDKKRPFVLGGLLKHEHKFSVLHFSVSKHPTYPVPIVSKEELIFCFGWRRLQVNPLFSEKYANLDKQKYSRFLHLGENGASTIYGPITFGTTPLVIFKETKDGLHLAGTGSYLQANPDVLLIKRVILTGNPLKVHKRSVLVRNLFHFPEDVKWFKPVELWTKKGRIGNIRESHGVHGLVRCIFNGHLSYQDTICLSLFRRVFPKWTTKDLIYDNEESKEMNN